MFYWRWRRGRGRGRGTARVSEREGEGRGGRGGQARGGRGGNGWEMPESSSSAGAVMLASLVAGAGLIGMGHTPGRGLDLLITYVGSCIELE
jgi:hypothetical protein